MGWKGLGLSAESKDEGGVECGGGGNREGSGEWSRKCEEWRVEGGAQRMESGECLDGVDGVESGE